MSSGRIERIGNHRKPSWLRSPNSKSNRNKK